MPVRPQFRRSCTKLVKLAIRSVPETASTVGGLGTLASVATLLKGVLNVMRIKKLAIAAAGSIALGTLSLVIANRARPWAVLPFRNRCRGTTNHWLEMLGRTAELLAR